MDNRGLSTVVEKLLSLAIALLVIGVLTTTLFGGAVPSYQAAVGAQLGERTLAEATARVEQTVPPTARTASATTRVDLPALIDGQSYEIRTDGRTLVLAHPDPDIEARTRPVLPESVGTLAGSWQSGTTLVVTATGQRQSQTIRIANP